MKSPLIIDPKQEAKKITDFLKKTFSEQKMNKVVLGLSGGIDSTVALYLLKKVLPPQNIFAVQMDYKPRKELIIDLKGINIINFPIKKFVDSFKDEVSKNFSLSRGPRSGETLAAIKFSSPSLSEADNKTRLGNIMARTRMIILFDLAKQIGGLVCGTENKSEKLLGYFTRFGDAASDFEPISHLYKTQVYQLAKYLGIPKETINQPPSAGLWDGQTDENDFGFSYLEADQVLHLYYDEKISLEEIKKQGFKNAERIITRSLNNQFKQKTPYHI